MSNWRNLFAQRIYERGKDYYYHGRVKNLMLDEDDSFSAIVKGNRTYKVTGRYHNGKPSTWEEEAGGFLSSRPAWSTE